MAFSELAASLERRGFAPILEAEYENHAWQVVALQQGRPVALSVHPSVGHLGAVRPAPTTDIPRPPPGAMPLSEIARQLEEAGYTPILEAEFEGDEGWEIEALALVEVDVDVHGNVSGMEIDADDGLESLGR